MDSKEKKLRKLVREQIQLQLNEWHQDDVEDVAFALILKLSFKPDKTYIKDLETQSQADKAYVKGQIVILEFHDDKGYLKAKKFAMNNGLI